MKIQKMTGFNFIVCLFLATQLLEVHSTDSRPKCKHGYNAVVGSDYRINREENTFTCNTCNRNLNEKHDRRRSGQIECDACDVCPECIPEIDAEAPSPMEVGDWIEVNVLPPRGRSTGRVQTQSPQISEMKVGGWLEVDEKQTSRGRSTCKVQGKKQKKTSIRNARSTFDRLGTVDPALYGSYAEVFEVFNHYDAEIIIQQQTGKDPRFPKDGIRVCSGCSADIGKSSNETSLYSVFDTQARKIVESFTFVPGQKVYVVPASSDPHKKKVVKFVFYDGEQFEGLKSIGFYDANNNALEDSRFYVDGLPVVRFHVPKRNERGEFVIKSVVDKSAVSYLLTFANKRVVTWHVIVNKQAMAFYENVEMSNRGTSELLTLTDLKTPDVFSLGAVVKVVNHENVEWENQFGVIVGEEKQEKRRSGVRFADEEEEETEKEEKTRTFKVRFDDEKLENQHVSEENLQLLKDIKPQFSFNFYTIENKEKLLSLKLIRFYDAHEQLINVRFRMNGEFGSDLTWTCGEGGVWILDVFTYGNEKVAYYDFISGPDESKLPISWQVLDENKKQVDTQHFKLKPNSRKQFYLLSNLKKVLTFEFSKAHHLSRQIKMSHLALMEHVKDKDRVFFPLLIHKNQEKCEKKKLEFTIEDETKPYQVHVYTSPDRFVTGYQFFAPVVSKMISEKHMNSFAPLSWKVYDSQRKEIESVNARNALTHGIYHFWQLNLKFIFAYTDGAGVKMSLRDMRFYTKRGEKIPVIFYMNGVRGTDLSWSYQETFSVKPKTLPSGERLPTVNQDVPKNGTEEEKKNGKKEWILEVFTKENKEIASYEIITRAEFSKRWSVWNSEGDLVSDYYAQMHKRASEKFLVDKESRPIFGAPRLQGHQKRNPKLMQDRHGRNVKAKKALRFSFERPRETKMFLLDHIILYDEREQPFGYVALKQEDNGKKKDIELKSYLKFDGETTIHVYIPADKQVSGYAFRTYNGQSGSLPQKWRVEEGHGVCIETRNERWDGEMSPVFYLWANKDHTWKKEPVKGAFTKAVGTTAVTRTVQYSERQTHQGGHCSVVVDGDWAVKTHNGTTYFWRDVNALKMIKKKVEGNPKIEEYAQVAPKLKRYDGTHGVLTITMEAGIRTLEKSWRSNGDQNDDHKKKEITKFLTDMGKILSILHEWNYVHGDIKPANIMLFNKGQNSKGGSWKFIDWDTSSEADEKIFGLTYQYAAPEVVTRTETKLKKSQDIWAVGAILHEMLTGERVYGKANSVKEIEEAAENWKLDESIVNGTGKGHEALRNLLAVNPCERWSAEQLRDFMAPEATQTELVGTIETVLANAIALEVCDKLRPEWDEKFEEIKQELSTGFLDVTTAMYQQFAALANVIGDPLPYLFIALPFEPSKNMLKRAFERLDKHAWIRMKILVPCQIPEHEGTELHFTDHPGFDIDVPTQTLVHLAKAISVGLKALATAVKFTGFTVDASPLTKYLDNFSPYLAEKFKEGSKEVDIEPFIEKAGSMFEEFVKKTKEGHGVRNTKERNVSTGFEDLRELLKAKGYDKDNKKLGLKGGLTAGLEKVIHIDSGRHLWVCEKHRTKEALQKYRLQADETKVDPGHLKVLGGIPRFGHRNKKQKGKKGRSKK